MGGAMKHTPVHVLLDPVGDAIVPEGYQVVDTEVAFLQNAVLPKRLFIRGKWLCEWAERFYKGRGIECQKAMSPSRALQHICPHLTDEQARSLAEHLKENGRIPDPNWKVEDVLYRLFPEGRWFDPLSAEHAAWWLVWLKEKSFSSAEQVLLGQQSESWAQSAEPPLKKIYQTCDPALAEKLVEEWLCLVPRERLEGDLPPFPLSLTEGWKRKVGETSLRWYLQGAERAFSYLESHGASREAKRIVAESGATYYLSNPSSFSKEKFWKLSPFLSQTTRQKLEPLIPSPEPSPLDKHASPEAILKWATDEYLPYRRWAILRGEDEHRQKAEQLARQFIHWFLEFYPRALQGGEAEQRFLIFRRVRQILSANKITLLVVLDGLGWQDALNLDAYLKECSDKLTAVEPEPVLSALPTITPFAKPAILRGECPRFALDEQKPLSEIGELLPEGNIPMERLAKAKPGELLIWRVNEPDNTYHDRHDPTTIAYNVEAQLFNLAKKLNDVIEGMPPAIPKQIVVTADHGRLLGNSQRRYQPPEGMQAKGRAAWGNCAVPFGDRGYWIDDKNGLIYLHAERFGLASHAAVPLDCDMFLAEGGKGGTEGFAHGGIHPEEVIVPWLVYLRDVEAPRLECRAVVSGQAGRTGDVQLEVSNLEKFPVQVDSLQLVMSGQEWHCLPVEQEVGALAVQKIHLVLPTLPSKPQWKQVLAKLRVAVDGVPFEVGVEIVDQTREMYQRTDLLRELE